MGEACKMMCPWASSLLSFEVLNVISYCSTPRQLQCSAKLCRSSPHFVQPYRTWTDDSTQSYRRVRCSISVCCSLHTCLWIATWLWVCNTGCSVTKTSQGLHLFTKQAYTVYLFYTTSVWQITCAFANAHRHHYIRVLHTLPETLTFICIYILALWFCT